MKHLRWLPLAAALLLAPLLSLAAGTAAVVDRIVAIVNDSVILQSELEQATLMAQSEMRQRGISPPAQAVLRTQVLERLILLKLQTQRAKEAGVKVEDRELNEVLANIAAQNKLSVAEFAQQVKAEGLDYISLREEIREQVLVQRVRQKEVASRIVVTDQDVDQYLAASGADDPNEFRLSHILVAVTEAGNPELREKARLKAESLLKRLRAGEDFAQLAVAESDGQQALQGGDLGWRKAASLPTAFSAVVPRLAIGQVSDVIEAPNGYNIIRLADKRSVGQRQTIVETHARHILLSTNTIRNEDATRAQAFELYDRLRKGDDFVALAKKYSDDPGSKMSGGDLNWQPAGSFAPEFQERIDALEPGQMTQPFHSQFGWHIARVEGRRTRDITEEARRARARQAIQQRKEGEEYEVWLRRLREEAYVEYRMASEQADSGAPAMFPARATAAP
ncbi:MAG: peptidylprolyl isomerase [Nevskia sp.]|nr:peptidylprolyl isomerase [Nevskia sp.]